MNRILGNVTKLCTPMQSLQLSRMLYRAALARLARCAR